ncbi:MAG TPA: sulfite exporter TauE/SafE family protein [Anaerolineaceae bacterium]|nr:sulfite exporter TauE/SafE family protein [Anaerolineaceae bacterium]
MVPNFFLLILVGFVAQMIDGALGMAYGVSSTTFLLTLGFPAATASASVHMAEVCTTAVSGLSHFRLGNIDRSLVKKLIIPGVLGGATGAYLLTQAPGDLIKPLVSAYLLIMGMVILRKALVKAPEPRQVTDHIVPLGLVGGFFDAIGGGGWGPIVTTTLVARGNDPRCTIGSVNFTEFFVTFTQSITFILTIGLTHWQTILGLLIGGVIAAPLAAVVAKRVPARGLMIMVGIIIILLSIRTIVQSISAFA